MSYDSNHMSTLINQIITPVDTHPQLCKGINESQSNESNCCDNYKTGKFFNTFILID